MSHDQVRAPQAQQRAQGAAVVSAYGTFRIVLMLLAGWSFFAGFALLTGFSGLSYEGVASQVAGAHMMVLAGVYAVLAWRREEYRLLLWIPYAAQLAIIIPGLWQLVFDQEVDAPLLLVVSILFFALLLYLWIDSHPLDFYRDDTDDDDVIRPDDEGYDDEGDSGPPDADGQPMTDQHGRPRRYRRSG